MGFMVFYKSINYVQIDFHFVPMVLVKLDLIFTFMTVK